MAQKYFYYIGVIDNEVGMKFVTSIDKQSKMALWDKDKKPLAMTQQTAKDYAEALAANLVPATVVRTFWELDNQPCWVKSEDEKNIEQLSSLVADVLKDVDFSGVDLNSSSFADGDLSLVNFSDADLTSVDFTRASIVECDFTDAILTGADCSYAQMTYCTFAGADMAGCILAESDLSNSDLSSCENLSSARYDNDTQWPDNDMLPEDFDSVCADDLSALKDEEDAPIMSDGEY